jgi:maleate isomerase
MTTVLADRAVFGVIIPSTNTVVEDEYNTARPPGVSFHAGRIFIKNEALDSDAAFEALLADLRLEIRRSIRDVMTAKPDHLVMGMSAETFWGGAEGNARFERFVREESGLAVTTGASACNAALRLFDAHRIGVITPYQAVGDEQVRTFFTELGFEVAAVKGLRCPSATSIANVQLATIRDAFLSVDGRDIDALVQAGTNLPAVKVAAELEMTLSKPVIAINAATLWHAYRTNGIEDRMSGVGCLLEEY